MPARDMAGSLDRGLNLLAGAAIAVGDIKHPYALARIFSIKPSGHFGQCLLAAAMVGHQGDAREAASFTRQPFNTRCANKARPDGVRRAFLCMFTRGLRGQRLVLRNPILSTQPRVNNLHSFDT